MWVSFESKSFESHAHVFSFTITYVSDWPYDINQPLDCETVHIMSLSSFLIRIIFLALPGIVGSVLYRKLKGKSSLKKDWEDVLEVLLFSLLSYALYGLGVVILNGVGWTHSTVTSFQAFFDDKIPVSWPEVLIASAIAIPLAFTASALYTYKTLNRIGRFVGVTKRYGDEDVWNYFHNIDEVQWVFVRDHKLDLIYFGWILVYSDSEKERELLLRDVRVYSNSTNDLLYEVSLMYVSRERFDLTIEVPLVQHDSAQVELEERE